MEWKPFLVKYCLCEIVRCPSHAKPVLSEQTFAYTYIEKSKQEMPVSRLSKRNEACNYMNKRSGKYCRYLNLGILSFGRFIESSTILRQILYHRLHTSFSQQEARNWQKWQRMWFKISQGMLPNRTRQPPG